MKIRYNVTFRLETRKDSETGKPVTTNIPIIMDFTFDGKRLFFYTGYRIDQVQWDPVLQKVKKNNMNADRITAATINDFLGEVENYAKSIYKEFKDVQKINPTVSKIRDELKKRLGIDTRKNTDFFEILQEFVNIESSKNSWTISTIKKFKTVKNQLEAFQNHRKHKIEFDDINENFLNQFVIYQRESRGHLNSTVAKNLKNLKWFLNWATRKGYNTKMDFKEYNPGFKGINKNKKIIFLTWPELMGLYNMEISKTYLAQVRDVFCFCCFTGLRYSDVYNLKKSNVKRNTIEFTTMKTDDMLTIDLNKYAREILEKYEDLDFPNEKCLPVISNQKMNNYLKELGELANLDSPENTIHYRGAERIEKSYKKWELLSTHVGRKTFITNALFFNIPSEVIMSWTGHKDHKVMEKYYKITREHKLREMDKFNQANQ